MPLAGGREPLEMGGAVQRNCSAWRLRGLANRRYVQRVPRLRPPDPPEGIRAIMTDRWGRTVVLTEDRWQHIIEGHRAMDGLDLALKSAVEGADQRHIARGAEKLFGKNLGPAKWLVAVVAYDESGRGTILTAYPQRRDPPLEGEIR